MAKDMMDYACDGDGDLLISDAGDFVRVESTEQHQADLIVSNKGEFKQNPTICVGAWKFVDDENFENIIRAIAVEFTKDGMNVKRVELTSDGIIKSDATYK